jgi:hypothetical protein
MDTCPGIAADQAAAMIVHGCARSSHLSGHKEQADIRVRRYRQSRTE